MFDIQLIILIVVSVFVLVLAIFVYKIFAFFRKLSKAVNEKDIKKTLDKVISLENKNSSEINLVKKEINRIKDLDLSHIQKVSVVRFNPFKEIGGDHSFCLALLDGKDNGFIITTLHTRERTRVYAKEIIKGKSELELSVDEKKALLKAQKS